MTLKITDVWPTEDDGVLNEWSISFSKTVSGLSSTGSAASSPIVLTDLIPYEAYRCTLTALKGGFRSEVVSAGSVAPLAMAGADTDGDGLLDVSELPISLK